MLRLRILPRIIMLLFPFVFMGRVIAQTPATDATTYDFVASDSTLFEDHQSAGNAGSVPSQWKMMGGKASIVQREDGRCISIDQYYTKMSPKITAKSGLGTRWSIEFDTWLDAGYDGNPGVQLIFQGKGDIATFTPNRDDFSVQFSSNQVSAPTPDDIIHEQYYNRWLHMELQFENKVLKVYCNKHLVLSTQAWNILPSSVLFTGNMSGNMPLLLKNVRIATGKK